jgi:hypothetical protein
MKENGIINAIKCKEIKPRKRKISEKKLSNPQNITCEKILERNEIHHGSFSQTWKEIDLVFYENIDNGLKFCGDYGIKRTNLKAALDYRNTSNSTISNSAVSL